MGGKRGRGRGRRQRRGGSSLKGAQRKGDKEMGVQELKKKTNSSGGETTIRQKCCFCFDFH
jgi:hypothetical protein